ncbi:MAG: DUF4446 family protein [Paenibacillaceae bacterium]
MGFLTDLDQGVVALSFSGFFVVVLILLILNMKQLSKTRKQYIQIINGGSAENIEQVLIGLQNNINDLIQQNNIRSVEIEQIKQYMRKMKSHLGVQRYNAFSQDGGSDLSFTIAILDEEQDGVVLTGIHGRDQTFLYAKPVEKGRSTYSLSPEEKVIIDQIAAKLNV